MATGTIKASPSVTKSKNTGTITVSGSDVVTTTFSVSDAVYHIVKGFQVSASSNMAIVQCYFSDDTTITVRVRNLITSSGTCNVTVYYC